jgi:hypothetical protein
MDKALNGDRGSRGRGWVLLAMGRDDDDRDAAWLRSGRVRRIVRLRSATPSGRRRGSRALGLGVDSLLLAIKAVVLAGSGPFLAANPWTAVALRLLGRRRIAVTGLYAVPGTRSYRILLRLLRDVPLITLSRIEAEHWNASGGRAVAVLYGNSYGYPPHRPTEAPGTRVFIGGASDRDGALIASLEAEIRSTEAAVRLTVVDGGAPDHWSRGPSEIRRPGYVPAETFGRLVCESDVVVLPLKDSGRSAGHMVLVGALEAGVPVLATRTQGIGEYIDGQWVRALDPTEPLLPQITAYAAERSGDGERIRHYWRRTFSLPAYVERVCSALDGSSRAPSRSPRRRRRRAVS